MGKIKQRDQNTWYSPLYCLTFWFELQIFSTTIHRLLECSILDRRLKVWKCYQKLMGHDVNVGINLSRFSFFLIVNIAFGGS
jgi:hypothetical protein